MDNEEPVQFLFSIAREIKRSFESPVIFLTMADYADCILNSLVDMRTAMLQHAKPERVLEIVNTFHLKWLQAIQDIENYKKRVNDTPRGTIVKAIDYTIGRVQKRRVYLRKYVKSIDKHTMAPPDRKILHADMDIIKDMEEIIIYALIEKKRCLSLSVDRVDFYMIVSDEIEELMNWLDRLNDYLATYICKVVDLKTPNLESDLTKTLRQIIDEVAYISSPEAQKVDQDLSLKSKRAIARIVNSANDIKIAAVIDKIQDLERRIEQLKTEKSSALMALQHKTMYLEDRLQSLENLKTSVSLLRDKEQIQSTPSDKELNEDGISIFNHLLPHQQRCRLVEDLLKLWQTAIIGEHTSIISILSATDIKEVFSDELGNFSIDKYGRKIYRKPNDDGLYQVNENNELILMRDDDKHVYFYDECGRYYLNNNRVRVYKAHARASEYTLHRGGVMLKLSEVEDGIEYHYDQLGRYYMREDGTHIYRDKNSEDEYVPDGLGNLVRLHDDEPEYEYCPVDPIETPSSLYLKEQVGDALKTCLAQVILAQPLDPIKSLADGLEKYYLNKQDQQARLIEQEELLAQRERGKSITLTRIPSSLHEEYQSTPDYNFVNYESHVPTDN